MSAEVRIADDAGITVVTLDRPPVNAMSVAFVEEIADAAQRLRERSPAPAAVVLAGGERAFSAGLDLRALPGLDADAQRALVHGLNRMFSAWYALPFPVVAAVTGHAIAGGMLLALCADLRVGSENGTYGLTELQAGVSYPVAAIGLARAELSPATARRITLRADLVEAGAALSLGLLDEVRPAAEVRTRAAELAQELAGLDAAGYAKAKAALRGDAIAAMTRDMPGDPCLDGWLPSDIGARVARLLDRG